MSAPNSNYDPVEVSPLRADEVERFRDEAVAAIAEATDLDQLKRLTPEPVFDAATSAAMQNEWKRLTTGK